MTVRRYPVLDAEVLRCPTCGTRARVNWVEVEVDFETVQMIPGTLECVNGCWHAEVVDRKVEKPDSEEITE